MAKSKLLAILERVEGVQGVGLTRVGGGYAVKVNLSTHAERELPSEIDGVPVIVEVVGRILKQ